MKRHSPRWPERGELAAAVLAAWRQGHNTAEIAGGLKVSEALVCRLIVAEREARLERP